jgi:hypothetical protein
MIVGFWTGENLLAAGEGIAAGISGKANIIPARHDRWCCLRVSQGVVDMKKGRMVEAKVG